MPETAEEGTQSNEATNAAALQGVTMSYNVGGDITPSLGPHPWPSGVPVNGADETQTLTGAATGGTFALLLGPYRSAPLPAAATAAQVQAALAAMAPIGAGNVVCAGGPLGTAPVTCAFTGALSGAVVPPLVVDNTQATGGAVAAAVTTPGVAGTLKGAPTGALLTDTTNGELYINQGTNVRPTWTKIGP